MCLLLYRNGNPNWISFFPLLFILGCVLGSVCMYHVLPHFLSALQSPQGGTCTRGLARLLGGGRSYCTVCFLRPDVAQRRCSRVIAERKAFLSLKLLSLHNPKTNHAQIPVSSALHTTVVFLCVITRCPNIGFVGRLNSHWVLHFHLGIVCAFRNCYHQTFIIYG